jgi:hypothetical protein
MATSIGTMKQGVFTGPGNGTTVTITGVTHDAGAGGYLYFVLQHQNDNTPTVAYDGDSMTKFQSFSAQATFFDIYELANPSTGSNNLVLTYTAFQEYGTNIAYWVISTTGANGYGNIQTANGAAVGPGGLDCNIASVSSDSAVILAATIPTPVSYNQTLTVDGSTVDYDSGGNTTPYSQQSGTANRVTGWYKESVSTGDTNMLSDSGFQMGGLAFEVLAGATAGRRRIIIV